jgi:hypothetical protein
MGPVRVDRHSPESAAAVANKANQVGHPPSATASAPMLTAFITHEMRADWEANREALTEFWQSGRATGDVLPDALPWLFMRGYASRLPWAAVQLATMAGE